MTSENETINPEIPNSSKNGSFLRGGMVFARVRAIIFWGYLRAFWDCNNFRSSAPRSINGQPSTPDFVGNGKGGHYKRGLFTGGISRISKFSRISRKMNGRILLYLPESGGSLKSLESLENELF